jgi:hypothetical protein
MSSCRPFCRCGLPGLMRSSSLPSHQTDSLLRPQRGSVPFQQIGAVLTRPLGPALIPTIVGSRLSSRIIRTTAPNIARPEVSRRSSRARTSKTQSLLAFDATNVVGMQTTVCPQRAQLQIKLAMFGQAHWSPARYRVRQGYCSRSEIRCLRNIWPRCCPEP